MVHESAKICVRCPSMSANVRERPRKSANIRLRTVRLRTDAGIRGLRVSTYVHECPRKIEKVSGRLSRTFADDSAADCL